MANDKHSEFPLLWMKYSEPFKSLHIETFDELVAKFVKNGTFVRLENDKFKAHSLANFNISIAEFLFQRKCISKKERLMQKCLYAYPIGGWTHKILEKHKLMHVGEAVKTCIKKDGSFKPIGGKGAAVASNYQIAKILKKEGFLSEKEFLFVQRPHWKYRRLTKAEIGDADNIMINVSNWPNDTKKIISALNYRRRHSFLNYYLCPEQILKKVPLGFMAYEFLRIPPDSDTPIFKSTGYRLNKIFSPLWIEENLDDTLKIIQKTLKENYFLS